MPKKVLLTISILISNRPDTVEKCLKSLDSLRNKIPCELILTDTGCGAEVRETIKKYADVLLEFEWCRDFAKARNLGLDRAKGEWFLYLDDDEWFEDTEEIENFFLSGEYKKYGMAFYQQRNYGNKSGTAYEDIAVSRLVRLVNGVRFQYSIHECFQNALGPIKILHTFVHHFGYVYDNYKDFYTHSQRNLVPLLEEHEKDRRQLRHNIQLAQEYNGLQEYEKSIDISLAGIADYDGSSHADFHMNGLYVNIVNCYMKLGKYESAKEYAEKYILATNLNELGKATLNWMLVEIYFKCEEYEKCKDRINKYLYYYDKQAEDEEAFSFHKNILINGCFQSKDLYEKVSYAIQAAIVTEDTELAEQLLHRINLEDKVLVLEEKLINSLVDAYITTKNQMQQNKYGQMLKFLSGRRALMFTITAYLLHLYSEKSEALAESNADWLELKEIHWLFAYSHIRYLWNHTANIDAIQAEFKKLWKLPEELVLESLHIGLWEFAESISAKMADIFGDIPFYQWQDIMNKLSGMWKEDDLDRLQLIFENIFSTNDIKYHFWLSRYAWKKLMLLENPNDEADKEDNTTEMIRYLYDYAWHGNEVYRQIYEPSLLQEVSDLLPKQCQISMNVLRFESEFAAENYVVAVSTWKALQKMIPTLTKTMKAYGKRLQDKVKEQEENAEETRLELNSLKQSVLNKVRFLLKQNEPDAALGILIQLEQMVETDAEIQNLKELCKATM